jgi:hypothetical protein
MRTIATPTSKSSINLFSPWPHDCRYSLDAPAVD